jgi:hypothetical protein
VQGSFGFSVRCTLDLLSRSVTKRRFLLVAAACAAFVGLGAVSAYRVVPDALPDRLTNQEFWKLSTEASELGGFFRSDNLLSNEVFLQYVVPELNRLSKPGRVYLGVGPEQNFTYIAALKPAMAFIVDVRRGNFDLHLMYKALFELSADRIDFVSRLFSRKRPEGLTRSSTAAEIFQAFSRAESSDALYKENLAAIERDLTTTHAFALSSDDLGGAKGLEFVYKAFFTFGPELTYSSINGFNGFGGGGRAMPSYADLMMLTDESGQARGYLASEANFSILKDLESRNLIVPVVGNFGGPKAIRAVGAYVRAHHAIVSAFYLSNVEQYLRQDGIWSDFCRNAATLPVDEASLFIRSTRGGRAGGFGSLSNELEPIADVVKSCGPQ